MVRTSITHPLRIDSLPLANGHLGITFCPGKKGDSVFGQAWDRDLDLDLDAIKNWNANAVLTLIEDHEFEMLDVLRLGKAVRSRNIEWLHFPITDLGVPTEAASQHWRKISPRIHAIIERGGRVVVHCRGGLGRAGTIAALILTERGMSADDAISSVRSVRPNAIETAGQETWIRQKAPQTDQTRERIFACLLGGAIGDSLGAEIEFLSANQIRREYPDGFTDLPPHQRIRGAITDDTQMTLFTAEGIINAYQNAAKTGSFDVLSNVHKALLRWNCTQGGQSQVAPDFSGLITDRRLWARRAPGLTCLSSLSACQKLSSFARNDSKGCGTIMRVAPVALMTPRDQVRKLAIETSALTHGHPTGQLAAAAWAEMLADIASGMQLEQAAEATAAQYAGLDHGDETAFAIRRALKAPRDGTTETVHSLGGGWTADEALSIALYACLAGQSLDHALEISVVHNGDSDSTGAIAGNMLGLLKADEILNHRWGNAIEGVDLIYRLSYDICVGLGDQRNIVETLFEK